MTLGKDGRRMTMAPWSQSIWSSSPILPPSLVELIEPSSEEDCLTLKKTDHELDFSEVFDCDDDD